MRFGVERWMGVGGKVYEIHFWDSPLGRAVYGELLELKKRHGVSWTKLLAMLLDAYGKAVKGKVEALPPVAPMLYGIFVKKIDEWFRPRRNLNYISYKYMGRRLLYAIVARNPFYRVTLRVFEQKEEDNTRKYVLGDIVIRGVYPPDKQTMEAINKEMLTKAMELCKKDPLCRGVEIDSELNRLHRILT
jgi:hypothetical protein